MVTSFNLVYSASAAVRILGASVHAAQVQVRQWFSVVWVWVPGSRPRFMSKAAFKQHFVEFRRAAAKALRVTRHLMSPTNFSVRNESNGSVYVLQAVSSGLVCECDDYQNQARFLGKACCKHGYAVLSHLGFSSLSGYLSAMQPGGYLVDPATAPVQGRQRAETFRGKSIE